MSETKIRFSQKALEKSLSSHNSDVLSGVKSRWTWLLFSAITLLFGVMIFWGFYGSMVESVSGMGLIMRSEGSRPITVGGSGIISHLNIQNGSEVHSGQIVGQIYNAESFLKLQKITSEYAALRAQTDILAKGIQSIITKHVDVKAKKKELLDYLVAENEKSKKRAKDLAQIQKTLKDLRASTLAEYYRSLDQWLQTESALISTLIQNINNENESDSILWDKEEKLLNLKQQLDSKIHEVRLAEQMYSDAYWIRSTFTGKVREVFKEENSFVQVGEKIATVDSMQDEALYLLSFVSVQDAKKVHTGMSAFFSPFAVSSNDYGLMRCIVREIGSNPISLEAIQAELMNNSLTQMIAGKNAMVRVVLELIPDKKSPTKYNWTSKNDSGISITSGMLGQLMINTKYRSPASYIVPIIRELVRGEAQKTLENQE